MWTYEQATGRMRDDLGTLVGVGYSGSGVGKNNATMQFAVDLGPIPCGTYSIGMPRDTVKHGPYVLPLAPDASNAMYGRAGFLIHGDSLAAPGTASEGCIVLARDVRELIGKSLDHTLKVVSGSYQDDDETDS